MDCAHRCGCGFHLEPGEAPSAEVSPSLTSQCLSERRQVVTSQLGQSGLCVGLGCTSPPQPDTQPWNTVTSPEQERKGSPDGHTHRRPSAAAGDHRAGVCSGVRARWVQEGTPGPCFSRVTVLSAHHTRQTLCSALGHCWEVNRKPGQAG